MVSAWYNESSRFGNEALGGWNEESSRLGFDSVAIEI
jgi:hypothetical protein